MPKTKKQKTMTVAKYLVSLFPKTGVDTVPVFHGGNIMKFIDEVGEHPKLKYFCPYHEQGLAMIVDGYARMKGFGIGMVTSGPGASNLVTGIACAQFDSVPCMFITGQVGRFHMKKNRKVRQRGFQEADAVTMVKPFTKFAVTMENPEDARYLFEKAHYIATSGRPGAVVLDVPYDIQRKIINPAKLKGFTPPKTKIPSKAILSKATDKVLSMLKKSKKPVLLLGGGIRISKTVEQVQKLADLLNIPTVSTWGGSDILGSNYPLYGGNIGKNGNRSAVELVQSCDLLLSLGSRFTPKEVMNEAEFAGKAKVISVDIDVGELNDGLISINTKLNLDLKHFLPEMIKSLKNAKAKFGSDKWFKEFEQIKEKHYSTDITKKDHKNHFSPYKILDALSDELKKDDIIVADTGCNLVWTHQALRLKKGQRLFSAWGFSPMGYSFPAAIGAYLGNKNKKSRIIATIGDGGMQMNVQELQSIAFNKIPIKVFVFRNGCLGLLQSPCEGQFEGRAHAVNKDTGWYPPDFTRISEAYGVKAFQIKKGKDLRKQIKAAMDYKGPALIQIPIDPNMYIFEN